MVLVSQVYREPENLGWHSKLITNREMKRHHTLQGQLDTSWGLRFIPHSQALPFLGFHMALDCRWREEVDKIKGKLSQLMEALQGHKFTQSQGEYLFQCSALRQCLGVCASARHGL